MAGRAETEFRVPSGCDSYLEFDGETRGAIPSLGTIPAALFLES
jgi:hypothetical protein